MKTRNMHWKIIRSQPTMAWALWRGLVPLSTLKVAIGTLKVPNGTPKVLNGTLHVPSGTQPFHRTLMQFCILGHFFWDQLTLKKFFLAKLGHFGLSTSLVFKNWSNQVFFKTHEFMFQTRGIFPWLILFPKKKKIIITKISKKTWIHFKLGAFGSASFK